MPTPNPLDPCAPFTEAILESVGAAPPPAHVQAHLHGCPACRRLAAQTLQALALIDTLPPARVPGGFAPRTLARAQAARRGVRSLWLSAAAAAAVVVTAGLIAASWGSGRPVPAPPDALGDVATGPGIDPATPPPELLANLELLENYELLREFGVIEALEPVQARETFRGLD